MIHECKVQCHAMDPKTAELMGFDDSGKWLPFIFDMDMVEAAKMSSDESETATFNCTTIFTKSGDTYIINTPYKEFFEKFIEYYLDITDIDPSSSSDDLEL
jgi:hypothetical protein